MSGASLSEPPRANSLGYTDGKIGLCETLFRVGQTNVSEDVATAFLDLNSLSHGPATLVLPIQTTGLMPGDAVISILCLNEHGRQKLLSRSVQKSNSRTFRRETRRGTETAEKTSGHGPPRRMPLRQPNRDVEIALRESTEGGRKGASNRQAGQHLKPHVRPDTHRRAGT
jgi:hypothetical protein